MAYDAADGSERTRIPLADLPPSFTNPNRPAPLAPPTVVGGGVFAAGGIDAFLQRDLAQLVAADAEGGERWRYLPPGTETGGVVNRMLGPNVDEETVERVREQLGLEDGIGTLYGSPAVVDGVVIAAGIGEAGGDGPGGLFAVDAETGADEWAAPAGDGGFAPVVAGDTVYLTTTEGVDIVATDGTHRGRVDLEDRDPLPEWSPALGEGKLFVTTQQGVVALG